MKIRMLIMPIVYITLLSGCSTYDNYMELHGRCENIHHELAMMHNDPKTFTNNISHMKDFAIYRRRYLDLKSEYDELGCQSPVTDYFFPNNTLIPEDTSPPEIPNERSRSYPFPTLGG